MDVINRPAEIGSNAPRAVLCHNVTVDSQVSWPALKSQHATKKRRSMKLDDAP